MRGHDDSPVDPSAEIATVRDVSFASPRIFLRVRLDLRAPIHPANYTAASVNIFEAAGPSVGIGLGLVTEVPL
jgi:hypothetical protein